MPKTKTSNRDILGEILAELRTINAKIDLFTQKIEIGTTHEAAVQKVVDVKKRDGEITLETLREVANRLAQAKGPEIVGLLVPQYGHERKLSKVDPKYYPALLKAFEDRLAGGPEPEEEEIVEEDDPAPKPELTLDEVKAAAKQFLERNSKEALVALLKAFGASKLSEVPPARFAALYEALTNA